MKEPSAILLSDLKSRYIFFVFLLLVPCQLGLHLWPDWSLVRGIRVDYLSPTFFLTDALFLLFYLFWLLELLVNRKLKVLFQYKNSFLAIFIICALNIFFANKKEIAFIYWLRIFELVFLGLYVYLNWNMVKKLLLKVIPFWIIFILFLSILQILKEGTLGGLMYFLGERSFNISTPGIALVNLFGKNYLRPYATFPHPNAMAGFVLASLLLLVGLGIKNKYPKILIILALATLFLSFSKNSFLALLVIFFVWLIIYKLNINLKKTVSTFFATIIVATLIQFFLAETFVKSNFFLFESFSKRALLVYLSEKMFFNNWLVGVGAGNFVFVLPKYQNYILGVGDTSIIWWLQPVHNSFLLIVNEFGIIGIVFVFLFFLKILRVISKKNIDYAYSIFAILLTAIFDHYWVTAQQTRILLSIVIFGFFANHDTNKA